MMKEHHGWFTIARRGANAKSQHMYVERSVDNRFQLLIFSLIAGVGVGFRWPITARFTVCPFGHMSRSWEFSGKLIILCTFRFRFGRKGKNSIGTRRCERRSTRWERQTSLWWWRAIKKNVNRHAAIESEKIRFTKRRNRWNVCFEVSYYTWLWCILLYAGLCCCAAVMRNMSCVIFYCLAAWLS